MSEHANKVPTIASDQRKPVAQSCTLPYRRFAICRASQGPERARTYSRPAECNPAIQQINNLRCDGRDARATRKENMTESNPPIIEIRDLFHAYKRQQALGGVSFAVEQGSIHGFVGPNGAGKTTTLKSSRPSSNRNAAWCASSA